ncbi:hypothetical protein C5167_001852 [Papaver somniferum]|uniref:EamA domain-containing protein n=1 Tax=Papaver somniferum TaxID=3469 RepID=A0A4Y7KWH3_PAPSO|nr:hypothetical protein C5167_001852 [Papaver somniferum]
MSACCRIALSATSSNSNSSDYSLIHSSPHPYSSISSNTLFFNQRRGGGGRRKLGYHFRSSKPSKLWIIQSLGQEERGFLRSSEDGEPQIKDCLNDLGENKIGEDLEEEKKFNNNGDYDHDRKVEVMLAAATVILGVGNRVLYKLALVPLKQYPFFLAQLATFGYVVVYFSVLYFRYHAGIVTDEMLALPKAPFVGVGILEALAAASGMAAAAMLSGESIPILSQTFLIWQLLLSAIFLGRRYRVNQILGCFLVAIGVIITVTSGSGAGLSLKKAGLFWTLLMIASFFLQAGDTVLKEIIFKNATQKLKLFFVAGGHVDLFVVNSYGSAFQALFISLLLPFLSKLWGVPFTQLPSYLKDGAACFLNIGTLTKVPLSVYAFTLPLPYIGVASSLPAGFVMGASVLVVGLLVYTRTPPVRSPTSCSTIVTTTTTAAT